MKVYRRIWITFTAGVQKHESGVCASLASFLYRILLTHPSAVACVSCFFFSSFFLGILSILVNVPMRRKRFVQWFSIKRLLYSFIFFSLSLSLLLSTLLGIREGSQLSEMLWSISSYRRIVYQRLQAFSLPSVSFLSLYLKICLSSH